nr:hypothetical protein CFP56_38594 [Quercus suber]
MVVWMSANDGDVIRRDEFLHFYHLENPRTWAIMSLSCGIGLLGMTTRFSKQKLAKAQEKKAKGGTVNGFLSKKKTSNVSEKDFVTSIPPAHSPAKRPPSPTSSLEMIALGGEEIKKKKKTYFLPTFWDDTDAAALKAYEHFLWTI